VRDGGTPREDIMTEMKSYEPGSFCWVDLATSDPNGAKAFYSELFGWKTSDVPAGEGGVYTMLRIGDKEVAALSAQPPNMKAMGAPPAWNSYVAVKSADETAKKATSLGGTLLAGPFDVMDAGRMAVIQDPSGAVFSIWQGKKHLGAALREEPNTLCWNELLTKDTAKATPFYEGLFGWTAKTHGAHEYTEWMRGEEKQPVGGMMPIREEHGPQWKHMPSHWGIYFAVTDPDAVAARAAKLGGKVIAGPMDVPNVGRFATMQDPQGAFFSVIRMFPHHEESKR
jgi:uncharacterized protein